MAYGNNKNQLKRVTLGYLRKIVRNFNVGWVGAHRPVAMNVCTFIAFGLVNLFSMWQYSYIMLLIFLDLTLMIRNSRLVTSMITSTGAQQTLDMEKEYAYLRMWLARLLFSRLVWLYVLSMMLVVEYDETTTWYDWMLEYLTTWLIAPLITCVYVFEPVTINNDMSYGRRFEFFTARWAFFTGYAAMSWLLLPLCWMGIITPGFYVVYMSYISMAEATDHNRTKPSYARGLPYRKEVFATDPLEVIDSTIAKHA